MCLTACFLATGDLSFDNCFKMHVWSTTGPALVVPDILWSATCSLKNVCNLGMSEVFFYSYIRYNQKIFIRFEWNEKATLNLLTYQILNLQGE